MSDDVETLALVRSDEEGRDMIELGVAEAISSGGFSRMHARSADFVGNVEEVKPVRRPRLLEQGAHPLPCAHGVRVKVENDRNARAQEVDDMRRKRHAQPVATLEIVSERPQFRRIELIDPAILADRQRPLRLSKSRRERRFPCRDLAAQHVKGGV